MLFFCFNDMAWVMQWYHQLLNCFWPFFFFFFFASGFKLLNWTVKRFVHHSSFINSAMNTTWMCGEHRWEKWGKEKNCWFNSERKISGFHTSLRCSRHSQVRSRSNAANHFFFSLFFPPNRFQPKPNLLLSKKKDRIIKKKNLLERYERRNKKFIRNARLARYHQPVNTEIINPLLTCIFHHNNNKKR